MASPSGIAILITDSFGDPFEEIRIRYGPTIISEAQKHGVDCFYIKGIRPSKVADLAERFSNKLRYSTLWPLQRFFDEITLAAFRLKSPCVVRAEEQLSVEVQEGLRTLGVKVLAGFRYLSQDYLYVLKITSSSVINFKVFLDTLEQFQIAGNGPLYAGSIIGFNRDMEFVSGANLLLNRESIKLLEAKKFFWSHGNLDDVAIGKIMKKSKVVPREMSTLNLHSVDEVKNLKELDIAGVGHFRCKSSSNPRNDLQIIDTLIKRLNYQIGLKQ
jgi:hypothetical protein